MSKKTNLEYHPSQELPFISHLQKLEDSITDSHAAIDHDNWEDLKTCIDILKDHTLSDELIIRFTKLGTSLQNTGMIISSFYDALLETHCWFHSLKTGGFLFSSIRFWNCSFCIGIFDDFIIKLLNFWQFGQYSPFSFIRTLFNPCLAVIHKNAAG